MVERTKKQHQPDNEELSAPSTSAIHTSQSAMQEDPEDQTGTRPAQTGGKSGKIMRDDELVIKTSEQIEIVTSFDQLGISEQLLRGKSPPACISLNFALFVQASTHMGSTNPLLSSKGPSCRSSSDAM